MTKAVNATVRPMARRAARISSAIMGIPLGTGSWFLLVYAADPSTVSPVDTLRIHAEGGHPRNPPIACGRATCATLHPATHPVHFSFFEPQMVTLRVLRHDRHEQVLAECLSAVVPARGEVLQLDTLDEQGEMS